MISQSSAFNESALTGRLNFLDTGAANARIRIYGGTRPANGAATAEPMLVEIALTKPAGVVSAGTLVLDSNDLATIAVSGSPTWARVVNGNGDHAFDCDAQGGPGATGEVILADATLYAGGKAALVSAVLG